MLQIRKFKPQMVAIRDAGKVKQLQELIKDVDAQPDILVGDEGAVEVSQRLQQRQYPTGRHNQQSVQGGCSFSAGAASSRCSLHKLAALPTLLSRSSSIGTAAIVSRA